MKVIPKIKVEDMDFIDGATTRDLLEKNGAIMANGEPNYYRIMFMKGQGAHITDKTWNRLKHWHDCCKSKVPWRHKSNCEKLNFKD